MPGKQELFVEPHNDEHPHFYQWLWGMIRRLLRRIGHERLPKFMKLAVSVAEPAGRITFQREPFRVPAEECGEYIVLSANLWHDWPRFKDMEKRLEAFASLVESERADLLLLQEVARTSTFKADEWLAKRLNMAYVYSRANGSQKIGFEEGLGIYSRFPLKRFPYLRQMRQAHNPFSRRLALGVEVDMPCGEVLAISAHLGLLRKENAKQLRALQTWAHHLAGGRSAIIAGDFNAPEHTRQIKHIRAYWMDTLREVVQNGGAPTHHIRFPWGGAFLSHRLDYIFLQPGKPAWRVLEVRHLDAPGCSHSDHLAVLARLTPVPSAA
ncbi:MAG: endonuclease/exonuclease/phosphatase family protein [Chloroflexota bacterium]|nr:endonuclease/exonuclease/phosphatase family protein [Chloroflexota bacterium]